MTLPEAAAIVRGGEVIGLGGNALNRAPIGLVCELVRQRKNSLRLVTTAGGLEVDILCLAGLVASVDAAFISYETEFGLARHYRKAVESGIVKANEHSCYTLISGLRAAAAGIGFMPVAGLVDTDLLEVGDYFAAVTDPFTGKAVNVVKAYRPDTSLIHADEADEMGNVWIYGPLYDDALLARASQKVLVTVERKVPSTKFRYAKSKPQIPGFLVTGLVHMPRGASPTSCCPAYGICRQGLEAFRNVKGPGELDAWIERWSVNRLRRGVRV